MMKKTYRLQYIIAGFLFVLLGAGYIALPHLQMSTTTEAKNAKKVEQTEEDVVAPDVKIPLVFEKNQGQFDPLVLFKTNLPQFNFFFTEDYALFDIVKPSGKVEAAVESFIDTADSFDHVIFRQYYENKNNGSSVTGIDKLSGKVNYLIGDVQKHIKNIPLYESILVQSIYNNIDLKYYSDGENLKYEYIVKPGGDTSDIVIRYDSSYASGDVVKEVVPVDLKLEKNGDLRVVSDYGEFLEKSPYIYQDIKGERVTVKGGFKIVSNDTFVYTVKKYNPNYDLIIDPNVEYGTYLASSNSSAEVAYDVVVDGDIAYVVGDSWGTDFPLLTTGSAPGGYDTVLGGGLDAFVLKIDTTQSGANSLLFNTFIGGSLSDFGRSVVLDTSGNVFVGGETNSTDFPIQGATFQTSSPTNDNFSNNAFVAKLSNNGSSLLASTYLGGSEDEDVYRILVDSFDNILVAGNTMSAEDDTNPFPLSNPYVAIHPTTGAFREPFLTKFSNDLTTAFFSSYLNNTGSAPLADAAMDSNNDIYVTGRANTISDPFPGLTGYDTTRNGLNNYSYIVKYNSNLISQEWGTLFEDSSANIAVEAYAIDVLTIGGADYVALAGRVGPGATGFPLLNAHQATQGTGSDGFVSLFDSNITGVGSLLFSTFYGGNNSNSLIDDEFLEEVAFDGVGNIYVAGLTSSANLPTLNPVRIGFAPTNRPDGAIAKYNLSGVLQFSSYWAASSGLSNTDKIHALDVTDNGVMYFAGETGSTPGFGVGIDPNTTDTVNGILINPSNQNDAFFAKVRTINLAPVVPTLVSPADATVTYDSTPTFSVLYKDPDLSDVGTTNFRISSGSAADCLNNISIVDSGVSNLSLSQTTSPRSSATNYYTSAALGAGSYNWCAQNNDGDLTSGSGFTTMGSFSIPDIAQDVTDLSADAFDASIVLDWTINSVEPVIDHEIEYWETGLGRGSSTTILTSSSDPTYTAGGLNNGTSYSFIVRPITAGGTSGDSNTAVATPDTIVTKRRVEIHVASTNIAGQNASTGISDGGSGTDFTPFGPTQTNYSGARRYGFETGTTNATEVSIPVNIETIPSPTIVNLGDDDISSIIDSPFPFLMYGVEQNSIRIASNGVVYTEGFDQNLTSTNSACCSGQSLSSQSLTNGDDMVVAGIWRDLTPQASSISYGVVGSAPYRKFIVQFNSVNAFGSVAGGNTFQIKFYELALPPGPPSTSINLAASSGLSQVNLTWSNFSANPAITDHEVEYWGTIAGRDTATIVNTGSASTSYTVNGLTNGTHYSFIVRPINAQGTAADSNIATATPSQPAGLIEIHISSSNGQGDSIGVGVSGGDASPADDDATIGGIDTPDPGPLSGATRFSFAPDGSVTESAVTLSPAVLTGGATDFTASFNDQDDGRYDIPLGAIPFTFSMFGRDNDRIRAFTNGYFLADNQAITSTFIRYGSSMAAQDVTNSSTSHFIAGLFVDLDFSTCGTASYELQGSAPNRVFIINYEDVCYYQVAGGGNTVQIKIFEIDNAPAAPNPIPVLNSFAGDQKVKLTWTNPTANPSISDVEIEYWQTSLGRGSSTTVNAGSAVQTYTVTGLTNGVNYSFLVRPINGQGTATDSILATSAPTPPYGVVELHISSTNAGGQSMVTGISKEAVGINSVPVTTSDYSGAYRYEFDSNGNPTEFPTTLNVQALSNDEPLILNDDAASADLFLPEDFNSVLYSEAVGALKIISNGYIFANDFADGIDANNNLGGAISTNPVSLTGQTVSQFDDSMYALFWSDLDPSACGTISYGIEGTYPNRVAIIYFNDVCRVGDNGGGFTGQIKIFEVATDTGPLQVKHVSATSGDTQVILNWRTPTASSITDYVVEYGLTSGAPGNFVVFPHGSSATTTTVTGLTNGASYSFRISGVNGFGTGAASSILTATPNDPCPTQLNTSGANPVVTESFCDTSLKSGSTTGYWGVSGAANILNEFRGATVYDTYSTDAKPRSLVIGDFNQDSRNDLFYVAETQPSMQVIINDASTNFESPSSPGTPNVYTFTSGTDPKDAAIGDFNHDNYPDIAVTLGSQNQVRVYLNNGTFASGLNNIFDIPGPDYTLSIGSGSAPYGITAFDIDNDGYSDLAITGDTTDQLSYYFNLADDTGAFSGQSGNLTPAATGTRAIATGDFNGDGLDDIVVGDQLNDRLIVVEAFSRSGFSLLQSPPPSPDSYINGITNPLEIVAGDVDKDGFDDLAVVQSGNQTVSILFGNGVGDFSTQYDYSTPGVGEPRSIYLDDVNNDTYKDLVFTVYNAAGDDSLVIWLNDLSGKDIDGPFDPATALVSHTYAFDNTLDDPSSVVTVNSTNYFRDFVTTHANSNKITIGPLLQNNVTSNVLQSSNSSFGNTYTSINVTTSSSFNGDTYLLEVSNDASNWQTVGGGALSSDLVSEAVALAGNALYWRATLNGSVISSPVINSISFELISAGGSVVGGSGAVRGTPNAPTPDPIRTGTTPAGEIKISWIDTSGNEDGFIIYDPADNVVEVLPPNTTSTTITETEPNTSYEFFIASFNDRGESVRVPFEAIITQLTAPRAIVASRTESSVSFGVDKLVPNIELGKTAIQYEVVIPKTILTDKQVFTSDWSSDPVVTFEDIAYDIELNVRVRVRNQVGIESDWSTFTVVPAGKVEGANVSIDFQLTADSGALLTDIVSPDTVFTGIVQITNIGDISAQDVLVTIPLTSYLTPINGSVFADDLRQTLEADKDIAQYGSNALSFIWPELADQESHIAVFKLVFDQTNLASLRDKQQALDEQIGGLDSLDISSEDLQRLIDRISENTLKNITTSNQLINLIRDIDQDQNRSSQTQLEDVNRIGQSPNQGISDTDFGDTIHGSPSDVNNEEFIDQSETNRDALPTEEVEIVPEIDEKAIKPSLKKLEAAAYYAAGLINPVFSIQAAVSHAQSNDPVYSQSYELTADLGSLPASSGSSSQVTPPTPIIPSTPVVPTVPGTSNPGTSNSAGGGTSQTGGLKNPSQPSTPIEQVNGALKLIGNVKTDSGYIIFSGTTSQSDADVSVIFDNGMQITTSSDQNGFWEVYVSADSLNIKDGQSGRVSAKVVAQKEGFDTEEIEVSKFVDRSQKGIRQEDSLDQPILRVDNLPIPLLVISLLVSTVLFGYLPYFPYLIWQFILWLIGLVTGRKKTYNFFGTVYNSISKEPLALAIVRIYDRTTKKLVATEVTDKLGRYDFLLPNGNYRVEVKKPEFTFPSRIIHDAVDGQYLNVYDEKVGFDISEDNIFAPDIPVDPLDKKGVIIPIMVFKKLFYSIRGLANWLAVPTLLVGLAMTIYAINLDSSSMINWVIAGLYILFLLTHLKLRTKIPKAWGYIYDLGNNQNLPLTPIQLIDSSYNKVVKNRLSDYEGRYYFRPIPGKYQIKVTKEGYQQTSERAKGRTSLNSESLNVQKENARITGDIAMRVDG